MISDVLSFLRSEQKNGRLKFKSDQKLAGLSSFGIGGPASFVVWPCSSDALLQTVRALEEMKERYAVIGNATNILFDDRGFCGTVISTVKANRLEFKCEEYGETLTAECGAMLPRIAFLAKEKGLCGFEGLSHIPATVGGAVASNAGAFGQEISDRLREISVLSCGREYILKTEKAMFSYRKSVVSDNGYILLKAVFSLPYGEKSEIIKKTELAKETRKSTQPTCVKSAGSYFKRPTFDDKIEYSRLSAGELIDRCGLKGKRIGGAMVSEKHANFLVNLGNAKSEDVLKLANEIKTEVFLKTGVKLLEEVRYLPYV